MLQVTRNADYAIRLMIEVGSQGDALIDTAEVARRQEIPFQFLRKVAQALVSNGLLIGERGQHGGLSLARPSESISMLDIVCAFGAPSLNRCTLNPPNCDRRDQCAVFPVWRRIQTQLEQSLARTLLSDLIRQQAKLQREANRRKQKEEAALVVTR